MFEKNYAISVGLGQFETVCGFCLASHFFEESQPTLCALCGAPFQEAQSISDLEEVKEQRWRIVDQALFQEFVYIFLEISLRHLIIVGVWVSPKGFFKAFLHFEIPSSIGDPDQFDANPI